jgi:hypothetical protein
MKRLSQNWPASRPSQSKNDFILVPYGPSAINPPVFVSGYDYTPGRPERIGLGVMIFIARPGSGSSE